MSRAEYASCVGKGLKGKHLSKEERRLEFCIVSKLCSHKSKDREEAKRICSLPKEPRPQKARAGKGQGKSCEKESLDTTNCMMNYFESHQTYQKLLNVNTVGQEIANALLECKCQK